MATSSSPIIQVDPKKLQSLFNNSQYPQLIAQNKLERIVLRSKCMQEKNLIKKKLPQGTKTEEIVYRDKQKGFYVKIHQYLKPDGTLGASGKLDPKSMLLDGKMYNYSKNPS